MCTFCVDKCADTLIKPVRLAHPMDTNTITHAHPPWLNCGRQQMRKQDLDKRGNIAPGRETGSKIQGDAEHTAFSRNLKNRLYSTSRIASHRIEPNRTRPIRIESIRTLPSAAAGVGCPRQCAIQYHWQPTGSITPRPKYGAAWHRSRQAGRSKTTQEETTGGTSRYMKRQ